MSKALLSLIDSIQVISLRERADRRNDVTKELAQYGLHPGQGVTQFFDAIRPTELGGFDSIGCRGCYLSHLGVLQNALAQGVERLLGLEDDAMFKPIVTDCPELLEFCKRQEWDFLYLGHVFPPEPGSLRWVETKEGVMCAHGYAVHRRVMPAVVKYLEECLQRPPGDPVGGPMPVDGALSMFRVAHDEVITYRASYSLILQRSSQSSIAGPSRFDTMMPAVLLHRVRKIKSWLRRRL